MAVISRSASFSLTAATYAAVLLLLSSIPYSARAFSRPPQPHKPPHLQTTPIPIPPPPPISTPVWSLSCPTSFPTSSPKHNASFSSMSILTFVTPVSVSSPKLWAISLYKTSLTRCSFLGVPKSGEEYNDISSTASSVTTTSGSAYSIRRRDSMGEAGLLPSDVDGAVGWRVTGREYRKTGGEKGPIMKGLGILQLLSPKQSKLVPVLGNISGWGGGAIVKKEKCEKLGHEWVRVEGGDERFEVLPNCVSYIQVKLKSVTDGRDHDVCIVEVVKTGVWDDVNKSVLWLKEGDIDQQPALDASTALYSGQLRNEGII